MDLKKAFSAMTAVAAAAAMCAAMAASAWAEGDIGINAANFPDNAFREYVKQFDSDNSGGFSRAELDAVEEINVSYSGITDLTGIEHFTKLTVLFCVNNQLTSLDVSNNTALNNLWCNGNKLTSLDVSNNTALTNLDCYDNQLTSLDISCNIALEQMSCGSNKLTSLDVSNNTNLTMLQCYINQLTNLDISKNTALEKLYCGQNQLKSLDADNNTALSVLNCPSNQLTSLDLSNNTVLEELTCSFNQITSLELSKNTNLTILDCCWNQLTHLDLSNNTYFDRITVNNNKLKSLKLPGFNSNNRQVTVICYSNRLPCLDLPDSAEVYEKNKGINSFPAGDVGNSYCLDELAKYGFDPARASGWNNAEYEPSANSLINIQSNSVTYSYECREGQILPFEIYFSSYGSSDPVSAFVERLYTKMLCRASEAEGKAHNAALITDKGCTATDVASGFVLGEELALKKLSNAEFVIRMYRTFMNREPDEGGLADWVNALDNGCSYAYILNSFVLSAEFGNICKEYGIETGRYEITEARDKSRNLTAFVSRMYTKALGRAYDIDGLNDWTNRVITGEATYAALAHGFIFSEELNNKNLSNEEFVDTLYATFFDRPADAEGKADWLGKLDRGEYTREQVLDGFLGAREFANLVKSFELSK